MGKVRDFKFSVQINRQAYKLKNAKVGEKGRGIRHVTYFYNFWNPLYIYLFIYYENHTKVHNEVKIQINKKAIKHKHSRIKSTSLLLKPGISACLLLMHNMSLITLAVEECALCIQLEWVKLETSNLVCRLIARPISQKSKSRSKGRGVRHVTYCYNFGTSSSLEWVKLETLSLVCRLIARSTNQKKCKSGEVSFSVILPFFSVSLN